MEFPNGVQAAFLVNSLNNYFKHCGQLKNSFDTAWVTPLGFRLRAERYGETMLW